MGWDTSTQAEKSWPLINRILFRFIFAYFVLYILPFPVTAVPTILRWDWAGKETVEPYLKTTVEFINDSLLEPYQKMWDKVVLWVGENVFHVAIEYRPAGSGDTTWNYVQVFCFAVLAAAIALAWSCVDFRRRNYARLHEWLRIYVRYYVASKMITYGAIKVIKSQFPTPDVDRLMMTYGESSPMRLLWTFMGASEGYNWFTGGGEMLGGLLLCFRRTTLLGAMVSFGVMMHVTALNFCYDVPVKLFSSHLVLMTVFLMVPDMTWLFNALILGRRTEYPGVTPLTRRRWLNLVLGVLGLVFVTAYVVAWLQIAQEGRKTFGDLVPRPPLYGLWEVEEFESAGAVRPALMTDAERWRTVTFSKQRAGNAFCIIETMTGGRLFHRVAVDETKHTITLTPVTGPPRPGITPSPAPVPPITLNYQPPDSEILIIEGSYAEHPVKVRLHRVDESQFLLLNRGFHWINELPYNVSEPRKGLAQKAK